MNRPDQRARPDRQNRPDPHGSDALRLRRALRVPSFTAATVLLGVTGHVAGGGGVPAPLTVVLIAAGLAALVAPFAAHRRGRWSLLAGVAGVQVGVHLALLQAENSDMAGMAGMTGGPGWAAGMHPLGYSVTSMTLAHGLAALGLAWWLHRGEDRAWAVVARFVAVLLEVVSVPVRAARVRLFASLAVVRPVSWCSGSVLTVRGPPAF